MSYDEESDHTNTYIAIGFIMAVVITVGLTAQYSYNVNQEYIQKLDKLYEQKTCDEIPMFEFEFNDNVRALLVDEKHQDKESEFDLGWSARYYEKCMKDIFPDGYPSEIQLVEYFTNITCEDLAIHVIKQKFEYPKASSIYNVKCSTPLETIILPDIVFEQSSVIAESNESIKSDYSDYGAQYELWEKKK